MKINKHDHPSSPCVCLCRALSLPLHRLRHSCSKGNTKIERMLRQKPIKHNAVTARYCRLCLCLILLCPLPVPTASHTLSIYAYPGYSSPLSSFCLTVYLSYIRHREPSCLVASSWPTNQIPSGFKILNSFLPEFSTHEAQY